jgi:hypothetical protein
LLLTHRQTRVFVELAGNTINSGGCFKFCHSLLAITRTTARSALV